MRALAGDSTMTSFLPLAEGMALRRRVAAAADPAAFLPAPPASRPAVLLLPAAGAAARLPRGDLEAFFGVALFAVAFFAVAVLGGIG